MLRARWCCILVLVVLLFESGCQSKNPLNRKAVSGTVTVDGKPVPNGSINFEPLQSGGVGSGAVISGGSYRISEEDGLPPGKYRVTIVGIEGEAFAAASGKMPGDEEMPATKSLVPDNWNADGQHNIEVQEAGPFVFNFQIENKS
jgi:hypothetical protein